MPLGAPYVGTAPDGCKEREEGVDGRDQLPGNQFEMFALVETTSREVVVEVRAVLPDRTVERKLVRRDARVVGHQCTGARQ